MKRWIISDMHFGHKNIINLEKRPFSSLEEMDEAIINNWNSTVDKLETVYVLGDVSFYNMEKTKEIINKLNGYKILIMGNHDKERTRNWWLDIGFDEVINYPIILDGFYILSHETQYLPEESVYINIHGHTHSKSINKYFYVNVSVENIDYKPISFDEIKAKFNVE